VKKNDIPLPLKVMLFQ